MQIEFDYRKVIALKVSRAVACGFLSDVSTQVKAHFPGVDRVFFEKDWLVWRFKRLEVKGLAIEILCYTCLMIGEDKIEVTPAVGGNGQLSAIWKVDEVENESRLNFKCRFTIELNIPFFLKPIAVPFAQNELKKLFDQYLENVEKLR